MHSFTASILLLALVLVATMLPLANAFLPKMTSFHRSSDTARFYTDDSLPSDIADNGQRVLAQRQQAWLERSVQYYSKVMREERRRNLGQVTDFESPQYQTEFTALAKQHYFALRKIKDGQWTHAEQLYRRILNQLLTEDCDHAKLAVTTLLLCLLLQRTGDTKKTRAAFVHFFRIAVVENEQGGECACSAKVLQAFALFEMKQGNALKALEIVQKAVELDPSLEPVLNWKQFRDVSERRQQRL